MTNKSLCQFRGVLYHSVVPPCGDAPKLADTHDRLIFWHGHGAIESQLFIAPKGTLTAGWVLGVVIEGKLNL